MLYQFNPIDGTPINGGIIELNYPIRQVSVLQPGTDFLRGVLLLDKSNNVHVYPESAIETVCSNKLIQENDAFNFIHFSNAKTISFLFVGSWHLYLCV